MTVHVREELLEGLEEGASPNDEARLQAHLDVCADCRNFARDLRRNDARLRDVLSPLALPPFARGRPPVPTGSTLGFATLARGAVAIAVVIVIGVALSARTPVASPGTPLASPSALASASSSPTGAAHAPSLAFLDRAVPSPTLILIDGGREIPQGSLGSGTIADPVVDNRSGRLAFWRWQSDTRVPAELLIWDGGLRQLTTTVDLPPWGAPLWSADGTTIYFAVGSAPSTAGPGVPPQRARLHAVNLTTGATRTLVTYTNRWPLHAVSADASHVAGFEGTFGEGRARYVVLDVNGTEVRSADVTQPYSTAFQADSPSALALGIQHRFESTDPATLHVWRADNFSARVATLQRAVISGALFWPGRNEVLVAAAAAARGPYELLALDVTSGTTRVLLTFDGPLAVRAIDGSGSRVVLDRGVAHDLYEYDLAGGVITGTGRPVAKPSGRNPEFVGFLSPK